jgi:uncharacterized protein (TIGR03435 family)
MKSVLALLLMGIVVQAPLQFEVASIKPNTGGPGPTMVQMPPTGRVNIVNATLRTLLRSAYRLQDYQIIGGPDWMNADRFDVQATPPTDLQPEPFVPCVAADCPLNRTQIMMQGLLADRFLLKTHSETRQLPIYELTIAKNGFKLKEVAAPPPRAPGTPPPPPPPPPPPGTAPPTNPSALPTPPPGLMMNFGVGFAAAAVPFAVLTSTLTQILGRPVIDKTGIKGYYDFKLVFSREGLANNSPAPPPPGGLTAGLDASDPVPSIFTAVQEVLGLRLDSSKGPVEVLLIDSVSKPTEN